MNLILEAVLRAIADMPTTRTTPHQTVLGPVPCSALVDGKPCDRTTNVLAPISFTHPKVRLIVNVPLCDLHLAQYNEIWSDEKGEPILEWSNHPAALVDDIKRFFEVLKHKYGIDWQQEIHEQHLQHN